MSDVRNIVSECKFDAKGNLDLSQIQSEALQNIIKNQCLPTPNSVTEKPSPATKTAEARIELKIKNSLFGGFLTALEKRTIRLDIARFAKDFPDVNRELENIDLKGGVSVVQNFVMAKREAKLNGVEPRFNNAFIGGFLKSYVNHNKHRADGDNKIHVGEYSKLIKAGRDAVIFEKQKLAARGSLPHNFETGMGPITPGANLFAINNPVAYKKLADFCQKNDVNLNGLFDKAELEASQMADKKYHPAYLTGYFKELISLIEKNGGKISKDMDRVFDKQLNNAGEQAAALAAKDDPQPNIAIKPVKINLEYDYARKNPEIYQQLSNLCALAGQDPQKVIDNATYNSTSFIIPKDNITNPRLRHDYIEGFVAKFVALAMPSGKITPSMMDQGNKTLHDAAAQRVVINARKLDK
jgi:hypothetical protein